VNARFVFNLSTKRNFIVFSCNFSRTVFLIQNLSLAHSKQFASMIIQNVPRRIKIIATTTCARHTIVNKRLPSRWCNLILMTPNQTNAILKSGHLNLFCQEFLQRRNLVLCLGKFFLQQRLLGLTSTDWNGAIFAVRATFIKGWHNIVAWSRRTYGHR
jgi:hypothetical protein